METGIDVSLVPWLLSAGIVLWFGTLALAVYVATLSRR